MPNNEIVINDTLKIKNAKTPTLADVLFSFTLADGIPVKGSQGYYSIQTLLSTLGQDTLENRKLAERYALGTENGEPVSSGAGYQSNAKYFWELCQQLASSVDGPALSARIAVLEEALTLQEDRGGMSPGFHWWLRETSALPERSVILDGSEILYSLPEANDILKFVGTRYGENDDQTGFFLPDLITTADNNSLGNFIRATASDDLIGSKESDAIRNISVPVILKNICEENFSDWVQGQSDYVSKELTYSDLIRAFDFVYTRFRFKYTSSSTLRYSWTRLYSTAGSNGAARVDNPQPNIEYSPSSVIKIDNTFEELDWGAFYTKNNENTYDGLIPYFKEVMVINITELLETYPSLKALTYQEIANILDAVPYIKSGESFELTHEYLSSLDINISVLKAMPILVF